MSEPAWRRLGTRGFEFRILRNHGKLGWHYDVAVRHASAPDLVRCLAEQELRALVAELDAEKVTHGDRPRAWSDEDRARLTAPR